MLFATELDTKCEKRTAHGCQWCTFHVSKWINALCIRLKLFFPKM